MGESERIYWDRASLIRANWPAYPNPTNYRYRLCSDIGPTYVPSSSRVCAPFIVIHDTMVGQAVVPLVGGKGHCTGRQTTSHRHWRYGTTRICRTGWRSPNPDRSGFAGPNISGKAFSCTGKRKVRKVGQPHTGRTERYEAALRQLVAEGALGEAKHFGAIIGRHRTLSELCWKACGDCLRG
jgi:hypothetical protein